MDIKSKVLNKITMKKLRNTTLQNQPPGIIAGIKKLLDEYQQEVNCNNSV